MAVYRGWGDRGACFHRGPLLLGIRASSWNADLYGKDAVTARSPKYAILAANNVRYAPRYRSLICYRYRCELGWLRLIFSANLGTGNFTHALSERPSMAAAWGSEHAPSTSMARPPAPALAQFSAIARQASADAPRGTSRIRLPKSNDGFVA
jgi:hypothetical protein